MASIFTAKELKQLAEWRGQLEQLTADIQQLAADARERYDARSEKWREGEAGQTADTELSYVSDAGDYCESAVDNLSSIEGTQA